MEEIAIMAMGIAVLYMAVKFRSNTKNIAKNGEQVEGVVFDIVQDTNPQSQAKFPVIRFVTSRKEWITEQYNISTLPGFLKKGQKIIIIYNPDNPKEFFVKSRTNSIVPVLLFLFGMIILSMGVVKLLHVQF
jgi:hypothetical protein